MTQVEMWSDEDGNLFRLTAEMPDWLSDIPQFSRGPAIANALIEQVRERKLDLWLLALGVVAAIGRQGDLERMMHALESTAE